MMALISQNSGGYTTKEAGRSTVFENYPKKSNVFLQFRVVPVTRADE